MDGIDIALRAIGAFYVLAGFFAARAALTSNLIDQAIAAISMKKTDPVETHRTIWLLSLAILFFAGGAFLMLLLEPAAWLFAICAVVQLAFYLFLGPYYFDVADPPPAAERQRSINASVVYGACTLFILWAAYTGRLTKLSETPPLLWGSALAAIALHIGYILRHTLFPVKRKSGFATFGGGDDESSPSDETDHTGADLSGSRRIKVMADYQCYPLWAMDEGKIGCFSPYHLGVSVAGRGSSTPPSTSTIRPTASGRKSATNSTSSKAWSLHGASSKSCQNARSLRSTRKARSSR